jgi:hypothetical protein
MWYLGEEIQPYYLKYASTFICKNANVQVYGVDHILNVKQIHTNDNKDLISSGNVSVWGHYGISSVACLQNVVELREL